MYIRKDLNIIFLCTLLLIMACNDPLEDTVEFNLRIENQTNKQYNVFRSSDIVSSGVYANVGTVQANNSITFRRLIVDVQYSFRLVEGEDPEQYDYQQVIQSGGDNITWSVP